jgi:predicted esterase YcpF (UPF0227 family)
VERNDLVITVLQQRIGDLVSNYETQIAILRAEITQMIDEKNEKKKNIEDYSNELISKISDVD